MTNPSPSAPDHPSGAGVPAERQLNPPRPRSAGANPQITKLIDTLIADGVPIETIRLFIRRERRKLRLLASTPPAQRKLIKAAGC